MTCVVQHTTTATSDTVQCSPGPLLAHATHDGYKVSGLVLRQTLESTQKPICTRRKHLLHLYMLHQTVHFRSITLCTRPLKFPQRNQFLTHDLVATAARRQALAQERPAAHWETTQVCQERCRWVPKIPSYSTIQNSCCNRAARDMYECPTPHRIS